MKRFQDRLFAEGRSFVAYPLRVVYLCTDDLAAARLSMLVSVPKKKFKRAVRRNRIKRLVREAYRLHKHDLTMRVTDSGRYLLVAFIFLDTELPTFADVEKAMKKAFRLLTEKNELEKNIAFSGESKVPLLSSTVENEPDPAVPEMKPEDS